MPRASYSPTLTVCILTGEPVLHRTAPLMYMRCISVCRFSVCVSLVEMTQYLRGDEARCGDQKDFEAAIARGELKIDDLPLAADQFAELCKADLFPRMLMGVQSSFTQQEIDRVINGALSLWLARYSTE